MSTADRTIDLAWSRPVSVFVSIRVGRRLPKVGPDLGGHASQHVAGDVLVSLRKRCIGPAHDLHRGSVWYA